MGFLNDMKKLLFGASAVTKSAADKVVEGAKDASEDLRNKAEDLFDDAMSAVEKVGSTVIDKAKDLTGMQDKAVEEPIETPVSTPTPVESAPSTPPPADLGARVNDLLDSSPAPETPAPPKVSASEAPLNFDSLDQSPEAGPSTASKVGSKVLDSTLEAGKKVEDMAAQAGEKLLDAGEVFMDKMKGVAENIGGAVMDKGGQIWDKVKEMQGEMITKTDDLYEKAKAEAAKETGSNQMEDLIKKASEMGEKIEEKARDKDRTFLDSMDDAKKNTLEKHDDFFSKAQRWADGDHGAFSKEPTISKDPNFKPTDKGSSNKGLSDGDGDGNDLIDDAIIDDGQ
jgi:ElaB/YqjD/DUF883 family membrane-anchored ribosome-binding protein